MTPLVANLWKLKFYKFFHASVTLVIPVIVLFWQQNGLSMTEIMILQAVFSVVMLGLEVPSGYFADLYGRKRTLVLASFFMFLGLLTYCFAGGFWGFLLAETLFAVGASALSGADSALLYDTLLELKRDKEFKYLWGKVISAMMFGMLLANIAGGLLATQNLRWPIYVGTPLALISLVLGFMLKEPIQHKPIVEKGHMKRLLSVIWNRILCSKSMRPWTIVNALLFTGVLSALWLYNPYFEWVGLPVFYWGFAFAAFNGVASVASSQAHRIESWFGLRGSVLLMFVVLGASYLAMAQVHALWGILFVAGSQFTRGLLDVLINDVVNKQVSSDVRATVLSGNSMIARVFYSGVILILGVIMDAHGVQISLQVLGVSILVSGLLAMGLLFRPGFANVKGN